MDTPLLLETHATLSGGDTTITCPVRVSASSLGSRAARIHVAIAIASARLAGLCPGFPTNEALRTFRTAKTDYPLGDWGAPTGEDGYGGIHNGWRVKDGQEEFVLTLGKDRARKLPTRAELEAWIDGTLPRVLVAIRDQERDYKAKNAAAQEIQRQERIRRVVTEGARRKVAKVHKAALVRTDAVARISAILAEVRAEAEGHLRDGATLTPEEGQELASWLTSAPDTSLAEIVVLVNAKVREATTPLYASLISGGDPIARA